MKNKIVWKLTLYFSAALLLFSVIIGSVFIALFRTHTISLHKTELEKRAVTMAETLSDLISSEQLSGGRLRGYGAYIRFLDKLAMADVWIVDESLNLLTCSHSMSGEQYQYKDLPQNAEAVVKDVFQGKTTFSEGFSGLLNAPTLTVGTPIEADGKVVGALLLHSPVDGMQEAVSQGFNILEISICVALALSILLSAMLAVAFTKPLKKMQDTATRLAGGDYRVKTGIKQQDEIGELALALDVLSERLDLASHESEQLDKLRRDFVANISHELRTPVTVIRGSLEALLDEVVTEPEQVKSYHRQMLSESLFLQRLVNELLDLSRLQNTDFKIEMHELSLCDVLNDAVRSAQHMAQPKHIEVRSEQESPVCAVTGDYGRLRQMFLIILDNAIKFSPENSVITVLLKHNTVSIQDNGVGIAQQDLPYIFDRFYKVRSEENKGGTGLGLAIAKQIADRHHIVLTVSSKPGEGSEFRFEFP